MKNNRKRVRPKCIFVLLVILCVLAIALSAAKGFTGSAAGSIVNMILAPMQNGINTIGNSAGKAADKRHSMAALESENEDLHNQIDMLNSRISSMEQNLNDYENLLKQVDLSEKYPGYDMTGARIIAKDPGNWYKNFTISKGSLDGIKAGMNVIADNGLVGIVTKTSPSSSIVRSIIDDSSSVSAMITKNYTNCVVNGSLELKDKNLLSVDMLTEDSDPVDGDEVVTSYISDKYLPGLLIGYISNVEQDKTDLTYTANVTPAVDFEHLSNVLVIKQLKSDLPDQGACASESESSADGTEQAQTADEE